VITFATDLYAPVIQATKTVANLTHPDGPTRAGDTLRYTVTYTNAGLEAAKNFVARDLLPSDTTYVAGSLRISGAPAAVATPSDLPGDDLGEYEPAAHAVRFFLGSGAAAGSGGELAVAGAPGDRAQISFEARVDDNVTAEREIRNVALATFVAPTLGKELTALSSEANIRATPAPMGSEPADLAVAQSETVAPAALGNDTVDDHVTIENHGPGDATAVELHLVVPPGAVVDSATVDQKSCSVSSTEVTCIVPHLDSGGSAEVNVVVVEPAGAAASGSLDEATVTASQFDPKPANDSEAVTAPMAPSAGPSAPITDVAVRDRESSAQVPLGGTLTETITVVNNGPGPVTGVDITDALGAAAEVVAVKPGAAMCASEAPLQCTLARLAPGASESLELSLRPLRPGRLIDAASVSAGELESNYANNVAKIAATVRRRRTAARVRVVPIQPVSHSGEVVGFVLTIAVTERAPGVMPTVCVTLPARLRLTAAPGAIAAGSRVCWDLTDLVRGKLQSFRLAARVGSVSRTGAAFAVRARLTGANFAARRSIATVQVPRKPVACTSSLNARPLARIAC
jgi:uncharacterized repeat protein (TIGR01451 family)